jgi:ADP-ribose pyrophosphatase
LSHPGFDWDAGSNPDVFTGSAHPSWQTSPVTGERPELPDPAETPAIVTLASREVYRNAWMRVREDHILRSNGQPGIYGVIEKDDAAIIIPIDGERIWLVEQFRYTIQKRVWELPQGGWEMYIDDPEELARGELREELGLHAEEMIYLGATWIAYGFNRQKQHVFIAKGLTPVEKDPDPEEHDLMMKSVPVSEFERMMLDGEVRDDCTLAAWALYLLWIRQQVPESADL